MVAKSIINKIKRVMPLIAAAGVGGFAIGVLLASR